MGESRAGINREKLKLIAELFDLLLYSTPDSVKERGLWYNDTFDSIIDQEISKLRIILSVYKNSRGLNRGWL
jgi:hypothetical protein